MADDPGFFIAHAALAHILMATGAADEAAKEWAMVLRLGGDRIGIQPRLELARSMVKTNLALPADDRDWEKRGQTFSTRLTPSRPIPRNRRCCARKCLVAQDRGPVAQRMIENLRDKDPANVALWCFLAALAERQADWDRAEKLLDDAQEKAGDKLTLRLARAQYLAKRYGAEAGPRLKPLSENLDKFTDAERLQLLNGLISPTLLAGDTRQGRQLCERIVEKDRDNVYIHFMRFELALRNHENGRSGRHPGRHQANHGRERHLAVRRGGLPEHASQGKPEEGGPRSGPPIFEAGG